MTTKNNVTKNDASEVKPTLNEQNEQNAQTIARLKKAIKGKKQDEKNDSENILTPEDLQNITKLLNEDVKSISSVIRNLVEMSFNNINCSKLVSIICFGDYSSKYFSISEDKKHKTIKEYTNKYITEVKKHIAYSNKKGGIFEPVKIADGLYKFEIVTNYQKILNIFIKSAYDNRKKESFIIDENKTYKKTKSGFEAYFITKEEKEQKEKEYKDAKDEKKTKNAIEKAKQLLEKDYQIIGKNTPVIDLMTEAEQLRYIKNWCKNHNYELTKKETKQIKDKEKATA